MPAAVGMRGCAGVWPSQRVAPSETLDSSRPATLLDQLPARLACPASSDGRRSRLSSPYVLLRLDEPLDRLRSDLRAELVVRHVVRELVDRQHVLAGRVGSPPYRGVVEPRFLYRPPGRCRWTCV